MSTALLIALNAMASPPISYAQSSASQDNKRIVGAFYVMLFEQKLLRQGCLHST
jgi:hypothetical protein